MRLPLGDRLSDPLLVAFGFAAAAATLGRSRDWEGSGKQAGNTRETSSPGWLGPVHCLRVTVPGVEIGDPLTS
jgi:hypothetical protein